MILVCASEVNLWHFANNAMCLLAVVCGVFWGAVSDFLGWGWVVKTHLNSSMNIHD